MSYKLTYKVYRLGPPHNFGVRQEEQSSSPQMTLLLVSEGSLPNQLCHQCTQVPRSQSAVLPPGHSRQFTFAWVWVFAIEHERSFSCQEACPSSLPPNTNLRC